MSVALLGGGDCVVEHGDSQARCRTSKPRAFGGSGASFSATDLLAAALGSCIASDLEPLALRHRIGLADIRIDVEKTLSSRPKRIESLRVTVHLPRSVTPELMERFHRAAGHCLVHRSLDRGLQVTVNVTGP